LVVCRLACAASDGRRWWSGGGCRGAPAPTPRHARPCAVCGSAAVAPALGGSSQDHRILLRSSAARSSLFTILLLQPVFFLRPWTRRKLKTGTGTRVRVPSTRGVGWWEERLRHGTWYLAAWAARRGTRGASCYGAKLINFCFGLKLRRSRWSRFLAISLFDFLLSTENRLLADLSCETVFLLNTTSTSES